MTSFVSHTTVDCANAYELSEWWKQLLGYVDIDGDPNLPGHEECMIRDAETGHVILFIEVADTKTVKNRVHFDLRPRTGTRDDEIERVRGLGAIEVGDHRGQYGPGTGWVVLADPDDNVSIVAVTGQVSQMRHLTTSSPALARSSEHVNDPRRTQVQRGPSMSRSSPRKR